MWLSSNSYKQSIGVETFKKVVFTVQNYINKIYMNNLCTFHLLTMFQFSFLQTLIDIYELRDYMPCRRSTLCILGQEIIVIFIEGLKSWFTTLNNSYTIAIKEIFIYYLNDSCRSTNFA